MKLNHPKKNNFLNYYESKEMFENGSGPFKLFTCIAPKESPNEIKLLIGYTTDGRGIVISNNKIDLVKDEDYIESYGISKQGLNSFYEKSTRPNFLGSIFRKPEIGDTVMCVSNERYVGCELGETYKVEKVTGDGRIGVSTLNSFTYSSKYFVVVDYKKIEITASRTITVNSGGATLSTGTGTDNRYSASHKLDIVGDKSKDILIQRKALVDDNIKVRKVYENKKILTRKPIESSVNKKIRLRQVGIIERKLNK